jgi:CRP-like cAMP-binding protein
MPRHGNGEAKATLRRLLERNADRFGLTSMAVTSLTDGALINRIAPDRPVFAAEDASDFVSFLIEGVVKVGCTAPNGNPMTLVFARPGQFIVTGWLFEGRPPRRTFGAIAHHDEAIVAMWSQEAIAAMMDGLPTRRALQLMSYGWRAFSSQLYQTFLMLPMPVRDRLLCQLRILARDFGQPWEGIPSGLLIRIYLKQTDLAFLVVASRENISKAFGELRAEGLVDMVDRRILVTQRGLSAAPMV